MTKHFEMAIEEARKLDPDQQNELADLIFAISKASSADNHLSPEDANALERGLDQARRGEFASDEEVEAAFAKCRS
ncbi:MAG: hypothetical protein AAFO62_09945 [Pseudomonadota bacterium]